METALLSEGTDTEQQQGISPLMNTCVEVRS